MTVEPSRRFEHVIICTNKGNLTRGCARPHLAGMKYFSTHIAALFVALTALLAIASFEAGTSRGQSQRAPKAESRVKPTVLIRDGRDDSPAKRESSASAFNPAAARNAVLRSDLTWTFGGKQQRGWYLYTPLISHMLNSEDDAASNGFASTLARWQENSGLKPNGVLDEESLQGPSLYVPYFDLLVSASGACQNLASWREGDRLYPLSMSNQCSDISICL
jgi:hypothetical protein